MAAKHTDYDIYIYTHTSNNTQKREKFKKSFKKLRSHKRNVT